VVDLEPDDPLQPTAELADCILAALARAARRNPRTPACRASHRAPGRRLRARPL